MENDRDRWTCPACGGRFEILSELIDHVEERHPADNVTLLQPRVPAEGAEGSPPRALGDVELPGLEPFPDFRAAAHAVAEELTNDPERRTSALILRLLGTVLAAEGGATEEASGAVGSEGDDDPHVDPSTGLGNRRAWLDALAVEEDRCRRHGVEASVIVLGFDGGHGGPVDAAVRLIARYTRAHDIVARVRDDVLGVLAVHCSETDASVIAERMVDAIDLERLAAQVGVASRGVRRDLYGAWELAEQRLRGRNGPEPPIASGS